MNNDTLQQLMRDATRLTQAGRLSEATAAIQRALVGEEAGEVVDDVAGEVIDNEVLPEAASDDFSTGSHTHAGLTRAYKLYVPPGPVTRPRPLVVMLHGCTQNPDDFAAGTAMNEQARAQDFCVLYPAQSQEANPSRCWNWFKHNHQGRGRGEAALIADLTAAVLRVHGEGMDPQRVYIAGLSAGGAMAACVAAAFPELFAAVGVHSGLAPGAASNLSEAMAAMGGTAAAPTGRAVRLTVPVIVFQGDQDSTVNVRNGEQVIAAARGQHNEGPAPRVEQGSSAQGQRFTRSIYAAALHRPAAEYWLLQGAGHAWSGGRAAGSYTDAKGPDATGEMLRFFWAHPKG